MTSSGLETNVRVAKKTKSEDEKKATVFYCYYCDVGSTSLDAIRSHWTSMHKDDESSMFKYREHSDQRAKCAYCGEPGTKSILISHIKQKHGVDKALLLVEKDEDGWTCQWYVEYFYSLSIYSLTLDPTHYGSKKICFFFFFIFNARPCTKVLLH